MTKGSKVTRVWRFKEIPAFFRRLEPMPPEMFENTSEPGMGAESDRPKRRRPVSTAKRRWLPEELALLGKVTDREAAEKLKRSRSSVTSQRCALGIARLPGQASWTREEIELVGTVPDEEAARLLGRSVRAVEHKRTSLARREPGQGKPHWKEEELRL